MNKDSWRTDLSFQPKELPEPLTRSEEIEEQVKILLLLCSILALIYQLCMLGLETYLLSCP